MNQFIRFLVTGAGGAILSLLITWLTTTFIFGEANYFAGYLFGIAANLTFNFSLYTMLVFKTKYDHLRRLLVFIAYGLVMAFFQAAVARALVSVFGTEYYLVLIALTIAALAVLNFFVFRLNIFKEQRGGERTPPLTVLALLCLMAVLVRLGTLFHALSTVGLKALVYGDAMGYRQLAQSLWSGDGFVSMNIAGVWAPEVFRTPGLPLLLAPFASTDSGMVLYLTLLGLISGIMLPYLTYRISKRFISTGAALIATALVAFEPQLIFFSILSHTEMPFILFGYSALFIGILAFDRNSYLLAAGSGALAGYAAFIRPGFWPVFAVSMIGLVAVLFFRSWRQASYALCILFVAFVTLMPWYTHIHRETGVYALSGAGWRNIYTDYLASVRATENRTDFATEKKRLKEEVASAGIERTELNSPESSAALREYALAELWEKKNTVLILEPILLQSFFLHDGYYYQFRRFGLIPPDTGGHVSATFTLLTKGVAGIPIVFQELARQWFMPVIGRLLSLSIFVFGLVGLVVVKHRIRFFFLSLIAFSAVTATAIGLGVESRLRLPVQPLLFFFAAAGIVAAWNYLQTWYAHRHRDSRV